MSTKNKASAQLKKIMNAEKRVLARLKDGPAVATEFTVFERSAVLRELEKSGRIVYEPDAHGMAMVWKLKPESFVEFLRRCGEDQKEAGMVSTAEDYARVRRLASRSWRVRSRCSSAATRRIGRIAT